MKIFALIPALLTALSFNALAQDFLSFEEREFLNTKNTLKVGVLEGDWLPYWGDLASKEGINIEYAESMLHDLHVGAEYVPYKSLNTLFDGLESGEIDLTVGFVATQKRAQRFLYSQPIFNTLRLIWLRDDSLADKPLDELKWVCVKDSSACDQVHALGFRHVHTVKNNLMMTASLNSGAVDAAVVGLSTLSSYGFKNPNGELVGKVVYNRSLKPGEVTVFTGKKSPKLMSIIDKYIKHSKESKHSRLHIEANINILHNELMLDILKQQQGHKTVRYTIQDNVYPLSYLDRETGELKGYVHDLLKLMEQKSMIKFEYVPTNGRDVDLMLQEKMVDLLPARNINLTDKKRFITTRTLGFLQYGFIESLNERAKKSVAILDRSGNFYPHFLDHPEYEFAAVYREFDCLMKAFEDGGISHAFVNQSLIDNHYYGGQGVKFKPATPPNDMQLKIKLGMELRKDSEFLRRVLNTVLKITTDAELKHLMDRHNKVTVQYGVDKETVVIWALGGVCILLVAVLIYIVRTGHLTRTIKRKEYETQIRQKQNKWLSSVLDQLPNKILISDDNNKQILANKPFVNMLSRCNVDKSIPDDEREQVLKLTRECVNTDAESAETSLCSLGDKHYRVRKQALLHPEEGAQYRMTVFDDITELKQKQCALKESNIKAMQAIEAREHFLAVVSHELRTPIAAMLGLMELLEPELKRRESKELLRNAMLSAERLKLHVNDILDFSKIDADQLQLDIQVGNSYQELGPMLRSFEKVVEQKDLAFHVKWTPSPYAFVELDWLRVNQIMNNLLSNAVKFTEQGHITVSLNIEQDALKLSVSDSGCGMNDSQLASLFQPFVQGDKSVSRRFGGTGLGMSIVYSLVKIMAGHIDVESQPEIGTTVYIQLPLKSEALELTGLGPVYTENAYIQKWLECWQVTLDEFEMRHHEIKADSNYSSIYPDLIHQKLDTSSMVYDSLEERPGQDWKGRVFVVDDDVINRLLFKRQFERLGVACDVAKSGTEALRQLCAIHDDTQQTPVSLIITDCHMPEMDGYQLTQTLKQNNSLKHIPVIACTAENSRNVVERAREFGIEEVLFKPYSLDDLRDLCEQYLALEITEEARNAWLSAYNQEESIEMAQVVCDALSSDIELIESGKESLKSVAHRIKGSAAALNLNPLQNLAKQCETLIGTPQEVQAKHALLQEMNSIVAITKQWLTLCESNK
ncbi:histidine kinase [Vibrio sp. 10N.222.52.B12]|uniref:ATP-binding protein n=1 Tax=Vibrio sp. 10N.222.52.B12 TaxID=1880840 RepID=UPI000C841636|nr:transporter substrate-binding domain-containing protein [Vibrio sp. 10N.222.52.B12]PMO36791.1 histidine kinase [Vibrio sp. 10N.222.52.B12]